MVGSAVEVCTARGCLLRAGDDLAWFVETIVFSCSDLATTVGLYAARVVLFIFYGR